MKEEYDRLDKVARTHFKSLSYLAEMLKLSNGYFYSYKDRKKKFTQELLEKLTSLGINPDYIRSGNGEMMIGYKYDSPDAYMVKEPFARYDYNAKEKKINLPDLNNLTINELRQVLNWIEGNLTTIKEIIQKVDYINKESVE